MNYHYADANNNPIGPVTDDELHALYQTGNITLDTFVIEEGASEWQPYRSIPPTALNPIKTLVPSLQVARSRQEMPQHLVTTPTKKCPFCDEEISEAAKKCKHCGETIDVALRAAEEAQRMSSRQPAVYMNAGGGAVAASGAGVTQKRNFPHGLHLVLTIFTIGAWFPIWILHYLLRDRSYYL